MATSARPPASKQQQAVTAQSTPHTVDHNALHCSLHCPNMYVAGVPALNFPLFEDVHRGS